MQTRNRSLMGGWCVPVMVALAVVGFAAWAAAEAGSNPQGTAGSPNPNRTPVPVSIERGSQGFYLLRAGKPYTVHGVSGFDFLDQAVSAGATTIRTWGISNLKQGKLLDEAQSRGLAVLVGLWLGHKRDGFVYSDPAMVRKQYERLTREVMKYKDYPAILAWGVGNEAEAYGGKPWAAINQLAGFIHRVDPNHPTVCVIAGSSVERIRAVREQAPEIDILGINTYRHYAGVRKHLREAGWTKPYFITEMGIDGTWEAAKTDWGAPVEPPSGVKARTYIQRYQTLALDSSQCLGVFPFKWGYVPKGTSTWFSLFHKHGEPSAVVDALRHLWTGAWPEDRAPLVESLTVNGQRMKSSLHLRPGQSAKATVSYRGADPQELKIRWEIRPESKISGTQGSQKVSGVVKQAKLEPLDPHSVRFSAPLAPGAYRLYFFAYTPAERIGTANYPFYVDGQ